MHSQHLISLKGGTPWINSFDATSHLPRLVSNSSHLPAPVHLGSSALHSTPILPLPSQSNSATSSKHSLSQSPESRLRGTATSDSLLSASPAEASRSSLVTHPLIKETLSAALVDCFLPPPLSQHSPVSHKRDLASAFSSKLPPPPLAISLEQPTSLEDCCPPADLVLHSEAQALYPLTLAGPIIDEKSVSKIAVTNQDPTLKSPLLDCLTQATTLETFEPSNHIVDASSLATTSNPSSPSPTSPTTTTTHNLTTPHQATDPTAATPLLKTKPVLNLQPKPSTPNCSSPTVPIAQVCPDSFDIAAIGSITVVEDSTASKDPQLWPPSLSQSAQEN
ncbi:hypothetical protein PGT21_006003 [Puccinia graminis f. sp. tritici]|uniref:Uncharacterized protein n=1 Tax=Puccinia graminis f. sp. tritici TaxID=56615 RepID=A0A5B0S005_PUCGR|nr:hypothetical protein PGT21_006003 [Puccinia graminis f. sp. tritici]KAA1130373.1 hypothetical protein PGTUg99_005302 [Puccinia graminis f. sp. tritici]